MFIRTARTLALVTVGLLGALGALVVGFSSAVFLAVLIVSSLVGLATAVYARRDRAGDAPAAGEAESNGVRLGAIAAAGAAAGLLVATGVAVLFGAAAALLIPLLLAGAAVWAWRRRAVVLGVLGVLGALDHAGAVAAVAGPATPTMDPAVLSDAQLCLAWHRSYWLLHSPPPGSVRSEVVSTRARLLDELEQRDPAGFRRWLQSGDPAGNPSRYLTRNRTDTGGEPPTP